jgi:hypothetical protein
MFNYTAWKQLMITEFMDELGFITVDRFPGPNTTGNGFLHLAVFICVLKLTDELDALTVEAARRTIAGSQVRVNGQVVRGCFHRNPWKNSSELTPWDEYLAIASLSAVCGFEFGGDIVHFGIIHNWFFDNQSPAFPKLDSFQDRFPGLTAFYRMAFEFNTTLIEQIYLAGAIVKNVFNAEESIDSRMRTFCQIVSVKDKSKIIWCASLFWAWRTRRIYGTLGNMLKGYFKNDPKTGYGHGFSALPWVEIFKGIV